MEDVYKAMMHEALFSQKGRKTSYKKQIKSLLEIVQVPPIVVYQHRQNLHHVEEGNKKSTFYSSQ